jgi:hypothetical protein
MRGLLESDIPEAALNVEFMDLVTGRTCSLRKWHSAGIWLFWKHPDKQSNGEPNWVSWRKPTEDDIRRILLIFKGAAR